MDNLNAPLAPALSSRTLFRSTIAAICVATLILLGAVLPAEYGIDPTGIGSVIGLTAMGKLKVQLAKEEAAESQRVAAAAGAALATDATTAGGAEKLDSATVTLESGETIEVKLAMLKNQRAHYSWKVDTGSVYYDLHGETLKLPRTAPHRYQEGELSSAGGELVALFDGVHGWYWENRNDFPIRITVRAWGQYKEILEM
jgi:hypothetical protein